MKKPTLLPTEMAMSLESKPSVQLSKALPDLSELKVRSKSREVDMVMMKVISIYSMTKADLTLVTPLC